MAAVSIYVDDLDRALEFYRGALGFGVGEHHAPHFVQLSHEGMPLLLCKTPNGPRPRRRRIDGVVPGIGVPDAGEWYVAMEERGVPIIVPPPANSQDGRYFAIRDPSGNVLEVFELDNSSRTAR